MENIKKTAKSLTIDLLRRRRTAVAAEVVQEKVAVALEIEKNQIEMRKREVEVGAGEDHEIGVGQSPRIKGPDLETKSLDLETENQSPEIENPDRETVDVLDLEIRAHLGTEKKDINQEVVTKEAAAGIGGVAAKRERVAVETEKVVVGIEKVLNENVRRPQPNRHSARQLVLP